MCNKEDVEDYFEQIDEIADRYLGRDHFINYYQAYDFMSELEEVIDKDVRRMIDNGSNISAFHVMNHIFRVVGAMSTWMIPVGKQVCWQSRFINCG